MSTADFVPAFGLHRTSLVRAFAGRSRTYVLVGRTEVPLAQIVYWSRSAPVELCFRSSRTCFVETKRRRSTGQQPGTKSASRPVDELLINRLSTGRCVTPSFEIGFRLFVLLGRRSGELSAMPWRVRGTLVSWANCFVGVPSCPAPPRRPAARPDPTRPWYVRVLDSTCNPF